MPKTDLTLGAAQLGMAYGIANHRGKMDDDEVFEFLDEVYHLGIEKIDTSPAYGDSEQLIGRFLKQSGRNIKLVTKLPQLGFSSPATTNQLAPRVRAALESSLKTLEVAAVEDYLIHSEEDFILHGEALVEALRCCRQEGLVRRIGVSVYTPEAALKALDLGMDSIQLPCNILDRRFDKVDFFTAALSRSMMVYARSIYLQGLLLLPLEKILGWLPDAEKPLCQFRNLAHDLGRPLAELAFVYMRDKYGVDSLVVGMESVEQIHANLTLMEAPGLDEGVLQVINTVFANVPIHVLNPSLWKRI